MEKNVSVWKANINNGLILGMLSIVYTLVMYFLDLMFNKAQGYIFLLVLIVVIFFMLKSYRDNYLHGFIKYGQSVGAGVIIFLYLSIISAIFTYILYKFIDPGLIEKQLAMVEETLVNRGMPQQAIDSGMAVQRKIMVPEIIAPLSILSIMFYGTVISLLVSIFVKKEGNPLIDIPDNR
ncbi:MAG TPA: DUF4199 domain-containing protein [Bacteroidales bacterium]|nr:DUF4199 domain-containing protein [Bacteroidales bacterium]HRR92627.1 DUF4199 domain-containing protein [Bacteroidales bacterium]HRT90574.1 DUF4199 domain-containing protein [Bacteroidales bacterium]